MVSIGVDKAKYVRRSVKKRATDIKKGTKNIVKSTKTVFKKWDLDTMSR